MAKLDYGWFVLVDMNGLNDGTGWRVRRFYCSGL